MKRRARRRGFLRGLVWAAAVVAAAVLLTVLAPESRKKGLGPIAQTPPDASLSPSAPSRGYASPPAELRRGVNRPEGLARGEERAADRRDGDELAEKEKATQSEAVVGDRYRAKMAAPTDESVDQPAAASAYGQLRESEVQLRSMRPAAPPAIVQSESAATQTIPDAFAKPAPAADESLAARSMQLKSGALAADAVIHVRWDGADKDQSAPERLNANLLRNRIAVLRKSRLPSTSRRSQQQRPMIRRSTSPIKRLWIWGLPTPNRMANRSNCG